MDADVAAAADDDVVVVAVVVSICSVHCFAASSLSTPHPLRLAWLPVGTSRSTIYDEEEEEEQY